MDTLYTTGLRKVSRLSSFNTFLIRPLAAEILHIVWWDILFWASLYIYTDVAHYNFDAYQPIFTARTYARAVLGVVILSVRPSVCLSVTRVDCDKSKWRTVDILIPHERAITLLLWHQEWLVGDAPFPLKSALKVTHPPSKNADFDRFPLITSEPYEIAKKVQLRRI